MYHAGILHVHKIDAPVISVGNLTMGGTGKTPLVEFIARAVRRESNRRVCILTRGYGRARPRKRVVVSDGARILADAHAGGDEPRLLAEMLLDSQVAVVSDADRVSAARWAEQNLHSEVFILDDGFQHLRLARDLNIVTIDAGSPLAGDHLLPRGNLREPLTALARADCIVITRADDAHDLAALRSEVARLSDHRPALVSRTRTRSLRPLTNSNAVGMNAMDMEDSLPSSYPVAAFCALGNPQAFFSHLRREQFAVRFIQNFPDHHVYTQRDADAVAREAEKRGARILLTTAKDAVKLRKVRFSLPCYVVEIEIEFDDEDGFLKLVRRAVSNK